ncbi:MAG: ATP synthase F0 subunit B [Flavobacteriales bacterium]|jgi:F-type H+-transporting ATPase subunit b|nr:ATP synthase F0 subunit B [Flavobacteriales bacterium]|tara:strand:- start:1030 stop:1524 length:495 start_codon:yes stop_codon:yes gene_type:complete
MELVKPDIGLLFWMTTCFILLLFIMKKFAWGPILNALNEREAGIQKSLDEAEIAKKQVEDAVSKVEKILEEGRVEKENIIKIAQQELVDYKLEQQSKINAQISSQLVIAKEEIIQQKRAAVDELKNKVAELSIEIAEKIIKKELENKEQHNQLIKESVETLDFN